MRENVVNGIVADDRGNLWFGGFNRIYTVPLDSLDGDPRAFERPLPVIRLGLLDGMASTETAGGHQPTCWKLSDGRIAFATNRGVTVADPDEFEQASRNSSNPVIHQVSVNLQPADRRRSWIVFLNASVYKASMMHSFDELGRQRDFDYRRLLKMIADSGYHGSLDIEWEGRRLQPVEGVQASKRLLENTMASLKLPIQ